MRHAVAPFTMGVMYEFTLDVTFPKYERTGRERPVESLATADERNLAYRGLAAEDV